MSKLAQQEAKITEWLASQKEAMLALLTEVVNMVSGSYDKAGVDAVGKRFVRFFEEQGLLATGVFVEAADVRAGDRARDHDIVVRHRPLAGMAVHRTPLEEDRAQRLLVSCGEREAHQRTAQNVISLPVLA